MAMLKKRHALVDPEELVHLITNPNRIRHFHVGVTFDDGYLDNYENAFPILKRHGIRALFFLPTHFVGTHYLPWWDRVANAVRRTKKSEIVLSYPTTTKIAVDRANPDETVQSVLRAFSRTENADIEKYLAAVEEACDVPMPVLAEHRQFLSWDEAAEMSRAGMGIGSHSHSHRILGNLPASEQRTECIDSAAHIRQRGLGADTIAYPVGNLHSFNPDTIAFAKEAGYRAGFSNYGGLNLPDAIDPFDVKRIGMSLEENMPQLRLRLALTRMSRRQVW
jgi:peptidoglycan/xylan/chitin deacetylase (PgdA/CDA1 family)